ncbi:uncharacterized protein LOC108253033 [Diaphorina citri]|uniref:Uncharacterized protein LOC108253033 n=1 Tax=Diaphorina citri TaxID=121845 RepID=A0A1S4EI17_DIACI|nr:uncharacterized protein LOC108253033 [Diaphorina citri]
MLKLRVAKRTRQAITLEWNRVESEDDGDSMVAYLLQREDYRIRSWVPIYSGFSNSIMVDNLRPETCFKFRVQAFTKSSNTKQVLYSEEIYADTSDDFMSVTTFHRAIQYGDLNDIRKFVRERFVGDYPMCDVCKLYA